MEFPTPGDVAALQSLLGMEDQDDHAVPFDADVAAIASWAAAHADHPSYPQYPPPPSTPPTSYSGSTATTGTPVPTDSASDSSAGDSVRRDGEHKRRKRPKSSPSTPTVSDKPSAVDDDPKPRKPTYLVRKEEKSSLNDEIRLLEARLELLKVRAGLPTGEEKRTLASVQAANFEMEESIHSNLLGIARFHSLLSRHLHSVPVSPMKTFIQLSKDIGERRATLRAMREMKLRRAQELTESRMRYVDNTKPYATDERYITDDGVFHCKRFEIFPFDNVRDAKQVFDALMYFNSNVEIAVSDTLGKLTIREDMDMVEPTIWNHRLASAVDPDGVYIQELNTVGFSAFHEPADRSPYGIVAMDAVDVDELYPYKPHERIRKDVTAAMSITEVRVPGTHKKLVVLRRCTFFALHPPQFAVPAAIIEEMRASIADWSGVMAKFLRNALSTSTTTAGT